MNQPPIFVNVNGMITTTNFDFGSTSISQIDGRLMGLTGASVVRFNQDGSLDYTFGGGAIPVPISARSIAIQADGKVLVTGNIGGGSGSDVAVVRYNPDGSLDSTFSGDGISTVAVGISGNDWGSSVTVQADGKILVAGGSYRSGGSILSVVIRFNTDGSLDSTFNGSGIVVSDLATGYATEDLISISAQADGKILALANINHDFALIRYNSEGSLDTTFSDDGIVTTYLFGASSDSVTSFTSQTDGKILLAGASDRQIALVRYNSNGSLDSTFSGDGKLTFSLDTDALNSSDSARSVTVQSDGKILVAGRHMYYLSDTGMTSYSDFFLTRLNQDGTLDTTFGNNGVVLTDFGYQDQGYSIQLLADGKIVVVGTSSGNMAVARYNHDGSLDQIFGSQPVNYELQGPAVILDSDIRVFDRYLSTNSFKYASITLTRSGGANAEDLFSGSGIVAGQASGSVTVSNQAIGTYTYIDGTLTIAFDSEQATQSRVDRLLQSIAYSNSSDKPTAVVKIQWSLNDGNTGPQGSGGAMIGTATSTVLIGGGMGQMFSGTNANETFVGTTGNDTVDGGSGIDTVIYSGPPASFSVLKLYAGFVVSDMSGSHGTDALANVERLRFSSGSLALDVTGTAGTVAKLIGAVFGASVVKSRPDFVGAGLSYADGGMSDEALATLAIGVTGASTPQQIVNLLWSNVVGTNATPADAQPFIEMLNNGVSVGALVVLASETNLNKMNIDLAGLSLVGIEYI